MSRQTVYRQSGELSRQFHVIRQHFLDFQQIRDLRPQISRQHSALRAKAATCLSNNSSCLAEQWHRKFFGKSSQSVKINLEQIKPNNFFRLIIGNNNWLRQIFISTIRLNLPKKHSLIFIEKQLNELQ